MFITSVEKLQQYRNLHSGLEKAAQFLLAGDLQDFADGRYEIDGDTVYAIVSTCEGKGFCGVRLEAHRNYIDVQYCVSGKDIIGFRPLATCNSVFMPYDEAQDIIFFKDAARDWITLEGPDCVVFFPDDAHAPLAGDGLCKKIVLKIRV